MTHIEIKTINYNGKSIAITADETGTVYIGGRMASKPITANGLTFVWGSKNDGLPSGAKIALDKSQVFKIEQHAKEHNDAVKAKVAKAKAYQNTVNEGGEGFNPYK